MPGVETGTGTGTAASPRPLSGSPRPHSPFWRGPLPPASPRRSLRSARLSGGPCLSSVPCAGPLPCAPAVARSSGRGALTRCSAGCGRGGGPARGRAGGGAGGEAPVGSAASSPPTGVSHPPYSQIRGWGGEGAGVLLGIVQRRVRSPPPPNSGAGPLPASQVGGGGSPHPYSVPGIHIQTFVFTHQHTLSQVQGTQPPYLTYLVT